MKRNLLLVCILSGITLGIYGGYKFSQKLSELEQLDSNEDIQQSNL